MKRHNPLEDFWEQRAEEFGKPILGKLLGHVLRPDKGMPLWGLLYTTSEALYFQTFKTTNWFSALLGAGRNNNEDNQDKIVEIKASSIRIFRVKPSKKNLFPFLYKPEIIELCWVSENNIDKNMMIETDSEAQEFVASLPRQKPESVGSQNN